MQKTILKYKYQTQKYFLPPYDLKYHTKKRIYLLMMRKTERKFKCHTQCDF